MQEGLYLVKSPESSNPPRSANESLSPGTLPSRRRIARFSPCDHLIVEKQVSPFRPESGAPGPPENQPRRGSNASFGDFSLFALWAVVRARAAALVLFIAREPRLHSRGKRVSRCTNICNFVIRIYDHGISLPSVVSLRRWLSALTPRI